MNQQSPVPDERELKLTEALRTALDHAFFEAKTELEEDGCVTPFSILATSDGYVVTDHPGEDVDAIYDSVAMLLARELPEAYTFTYDGYIELDDGRHEAVICELAHRGDELASILALPYEVTQDGPAFWDDPIFAGPAEPLYPAGTQPIVSGAVKLAAQRASEQAAPGTATANEPEDSMKEA